MKNFLSKYIFPETYANKKGKLKPKYPSSSEWIFLLLAAFAIARLGYMQSCHHKEYDKLFSLDENSHIKIGEILDRNNKPLARQAMAIDLSFNYGRTAAGLKNLESLDDHREFPVCADVKNGDALLSGYFKPDCGLFKEKKVDKNKIFQDYFFEKNKALSEQCVEKGSGKKCPKIKFNDYIDYQNQLGEIYDIYNLSGFKFHPKQNGVLDRIYENWKYYSRYLEDTKTKTLGQIAVGKEEMLRLLALRNGKKDTVIEKEISDSIIKANNGKISEKALEKEKERKIKKLFDGAFGDITLSDYCSDSIEKDSLYKKIIELFGRKAKDVLKNECSYIKKINDFQQQIKEIKIADLKVKKSEKEDILKKMGYALNANSDREGYEKKIKEYWKDLKNKNISIGDFIGKYKEDNRWVVYINKKELYERNFFTHYLLSELLPSDELKTKLGIIDKNKKPLSDKILMGKKYCSIADSYIEKVMKKSGKAIEPGDSAKHNACQILYNYNIGKIMRFIASNKQFFPNYSKADEAIRKNYTYDHIKNGINNEDNIIVLTDEMPEINAYKMLPNVKNFSGYHTAGINFYKYDSFVNMLGSVSMEEDSKIKESTKDMKRILSGLNVNYDDVIKNKSAFAEYMLAPMLGLDLNVGMNIMDAIKTGTSVKNWYGIAPKYHNELKENKNIVLTIDSFMQSAAELELKKKCEELKADRGIAIIQDVRNGEIIAAAEYSSPYSSFTYIAENRKKEKCSISDNECKYSSTYTEYEQWKNAGFTSNMIYRTYKPGSTFKPFAMAIAIEKGIFSQKEIDGDVKFNLQEIYNFFLNPADKTLKKKYAHLLSSEDKDIMAAWTEIREHGNGKPDTGMFSLEKIIAKSSNVGTALAAYRLWQSEGSKISFKWEDFALFREAIKFGFGSRTGLGDNSGHPGNKESKGHLFFGQQYREKQKPEDKGARKLIIQEYLKSSYGQGIMDVTPIQLITAYSALVNGGTLHKPHIVKSVDGIEQEYESKSGVISPETSAIIRRYMKAVMDYGTGAGSRPEKVAMGGKTGTADIPIITSERKGKNGKERRLDSIKGKANLASFAGFIPYEKPEYMILVMIDENRNMASLGKKYHPQGADAAAPVVKKLADAIQEKYMRKGSDSNE